MDPDETDFDAWQDREFGERPELPTFTDEDLEAALYQAQLEQHV